MRLASKHCPLSGEQCRRDCSWRMGEDCAMAHIAAFFKVQLTDWRWRREPQGAEGAGRD